MKGKANRDTLPPCSLKHLDWLQESWPDFYRTGLLKYTSGKEARQKQDAKRADKHRKLWESEEKKAKGYFYDVERSLQYKICGREDCENRLYPPMKQYKKSKGREICQDCGVNSTHERKRLYMRVFLKIAQPQKSLKKSMLNVSRYKHFCRKNIA